MNRFSALATLVASLLLLSACLDDGRHDSIASGVVVDAPASTGSDADDPGANSLLTDIPVEAFAMSSDRAVVTTADLLVFDGPDGRPLITLDGTTEFGTPRVLLVEEDRGDWIKVRLPVRPNHRTGWVPAADVEVEPLDLAVFVDLQARTLTVRTGSGETIARSPVAVGSAEHSTPIGTFYVTDKLETPDPAGAYGPFALGLSGFSETLTEFAGGDGRIGIHGTNDPASIGRAVSHGCLRLPNHVIEELAAALPLGTPVHIV